MSSSGNEQPHRDRFDWDAFYAGLNRLDTLLGKSTLLRRFVPIPMVASGGFVSLTALGNRTSTQDLDYFLNPIGYGEEQNDVEAALKGQINAVSMELNYDSKWCNNDVSVFLTLLRDPGELFNRSISQGAVLYRGQNLVIYAVLWEWVLVRKMKRLQMEGQSQREEDLSDCIAILQVLISANGRPINKDDLKEFDHTDREPPIFDQTIEQVDNLYRQATGEPAIRGYCSPAPFLLQNIKRSTRTLATSQSLLGRMTSCPTMANVVYLNTYGAHGPNFVGGNLYLHGACV